MNFAAMSNWQDTSVFLQMLMEWESLNHFLINKFPLYSDLFLVTLLTSFCVCKIFFSALLTFVLIYILQIKL